MLGQLGIIVVGFADNIMVGHHSTDELAAASFVNNFFNLAFIFGMGFSYGLTPVIGNLFAQRKSESIGAVLKNSLCVNFAVGMLLSLCMLALLLNLDAFGQPRELYIYIIPYYILQLFSVVFAMLFNSFKQFSDGTTNTVTPMWIMLCANVLNIVGNYILIYGNFGAPELGLTGAGISTLFSRISMLAVFILIFTRSKKYKTYLKGFREERVNRHGTMQLCRLGFPIGFQMGVETASFSLSVIMMGWIGTLALAAYQIANVTTTLGFMLYYGIGAAVTIRVSTYRGAGDSKALQSAVKAGACIIAACVAVYILLLFVFREKIGFLFTNEAEVASLVATFCWFIIFYQVGDSMQILFANALRGLTDVKYMARAAFFCHICLSLPIGYFCGFVLDLGAAGIWCGFPVGLTTLGILLCRRFYRLTKQG